MTILWDGHEMTTGELSMIEGISAVTLGTQLPRLATPNGVNASST